VYAGVYNGVHDGVRGLEIVGIWRARVNLLTSTKCRGPIADVEVMHSR
jgi:hypothetical protein